MPSVFITCAVTGGGDTVGKSPHVPVSPEQIADAAIEAAKAGAAVVHCHVRDLDTGKQSRDLDLYKELTDRIRSSSTDVVLNLTGGTGADLTLGGVENPLPLDEAGTDLAGATERMAHIRECLPEIATIDMGTMNFGEGDYVMTNTTGQLDEIARQFADLPVTPELECFDTGHLWYAKDQDQRGLYEGKTVLAQLCMGVPWGAPDDMNTLMAMVNNVPSHWHYSAFSIGRRQLEYVAAAALVGANVRVGLEDNLYLSRGVLATNGQLVERAVTILEAMNFEVLGPEQVRSRLGLTKVG
ncbi:MAG: 3-keto-5-aminohexanoate cleavage protein [Acidimicrobiales bacterium]